MRRPRHPSDPPESSIESRHDALRTVRDALVATRDNLTASLDSAVDLLEEIRRTNTDNDTATAIGEVLDQARRWHPKATLQTTH